MKRKKSRSLVPSARDSEEDSDNSGSSISKIKLLHDLQEKFVQLQQSYIRKTCRCRRQIELSQTQEEMLHSEIWYKFHFRTQREYNHRILF